MDSERSTSPTSTSGDSPLHAAVRNKQLEEVWKTLDKNLVDVNVLNSKNETPLHVACSLGDEHKDIVEVLIAFGADPFIKDSKGRTSCQMCNFDMLSIVNRIDSPVVTDGDTLLHAAIRHGEIDNVQGIIIENTIDVNAINSNHETPLHIACTLGYKLIARVVVSNGGDMYKRDIYNNTPIHRAVSKGHPDVVTSLIDSDQRIIGYLGRSLLHFACGVGNVEFVTVLIEKYNLSPFALDAIKQTPLHIAASHGQEQVTKLLISRYNSHVDCLSNGGYTPLHLACYFGHVNLVRQLVIEYKANPCLFNDQLDTSLHLAALGGHRDLVKIMISELNCCPEVKGFQGRSILHHSSVSGSTEQTVMLIEQFNQHPSLTDNNRDTPLHLACLEGHEQLVTLLVGKYNCPVDVKNKYSQTPLHFACAAGDKNVVKILVSELKASTTIQDEQNDTPLNKAALNNKIQIVKMLITEFNCNPHVRGYLNRSLLHDACKEGHTELVEMLIADYSLDQHTIDDEGNTPLHFACRGGYADLAKLVLSKYPDVVYAINMKNETSLHHACIAGSLATVRVLIYYFKAESDIYEQDVDNESPIHKAAELGHTEIVLKMISEFKCSPKVRGLENKSLLHYACYNGQTHQYSPHSNETLLHMACSGGHLGMIRMLISDYNLNLNTLTNEGCSPLHLAAQHGHLNTVLTLLNEFNCKPDAKGNNSRNILHYACNGGNVKLVEVLINDFKLDPMSVDDEGNTPLHIAAECDKEEVLKFLLIKYKCPVDCINFSGQSALHKGACKGYVDLCNTLLSKFSANHNIQDYNNDTPLSIAVKNSNAQMVHILAHAYGCKLNMKDDYPLIHQVCILGPTGMLEELILNYGYDPKPVDCDQNSLLHTAAQCGRYDVVDLLITTFGGCCPINGRNLWQETPLHVACIAGHDKIAELLVLNKASINLRDINDNTLLKVAQLLGNHHVITAVIHILGFDSNEIHSKSLLYQVCANGVTDLLDVMLSDFCVDPCSIIDYKGNTALHIAIFNCHVEVASKLIISGCPIDCRNYRGLTPIHLICTQNLTPSVDSALKWLIHEVKADI